ncbi:MAG TPA: tail fiber domain-containing protein [Flavobacteriales bacterium]|nr:tail fiber domain-containing protein [Flavobacteriales bacterium]
MRTKDFLKHLILGAMLLTAGKVVGQSTTPGNVAGFSTDFLGWDNTGTNNFPLMVRHDLNQPIDWYTNALHRMRLWQNQTNTINSLTNINQNGFVGISDQPLFFNGSVGAFSRLHLVDRGTGTTNFGYYAQQLGYRRWQRNGVTFTGNSDHGYVGQKYILDGDNAPVYDKSDMVLHWSNDPVGEIGPDRLRFLFTSSKDGSAHGSGSDEGLEAMRFTPIDNATINAGLGDFYRGNILDPVNVNEPTERLDILNGRLRIRELPTTSSNDGVSKYMVVDNTGVVHWRNLPAAATPGCEWSRNTTYKQVISGLGSPGSGGGCPDREWLYNIGDPSFPTVLNGKMTVYQNNNERALRSGLHMKMVTLPTSPSESYGILSEVTPVSGQSTPVSYGVRASVKDPCNSSTGGSGYGYGTAGIVTKSNASAVTEMFGASGDAQVVSSGVANRMIGTHGRSYVNLGSTSESIGVWGRSVLFMATGSVLDSRGGSFLSQAWTSTATNSYGLTAMSESRYSGAITGSSYGVKAESRAILGGTVNDSYGLWAEGDNASNKNYGVYCAAGSTGGENFSLRAAQPGITSNDWSGWFDGRVTIVGDLYHGTTLIFSDASLKTNVEDVQDTRASLSSLQPRRYTYTEEAQARMGLDGDVQLGFIAQEVEQVLPELVSATTLAAIVDTSGTEIFPAQDVKAVNYVAIIPLLVAGYKEQQQTIDELQGRLDHLEQTLAACCANPDGSRMLDQGLNQPNEFDGSLNGSEKLRIQPNPFNERTTVFYTLDRGGRTQLLANSRDGRDLRVLQEADLEPGSYQFDWNTAALAPGMYYVTLLLDGQPLVKKAVKVAR